MATTSRKAARPNPHAAVSNQPHETESTIKKAVTVPPAEGTNPKTVKPGPGGHMLDLNNGGRRAVVSK